MRVRNGVRWLRRNLSVPHLRFKTTEPPPLEQLPSVVARILDRQTRLRAAGIIVVIGMLLGFVVGGGAVQYTQCIHGNSYRRDDLKGWLQLADTLDPVPRDPRTERVLAIVRAKDRQRDCSPL